MGADVSPTGSLVLASSPWGNAEIIAMHLAHNERGFIIYILYIPINI